jgi:hypothetical protein
VSFDMSDLKRVSVAVSVAVLLAIGSLTIVPATAKEGVARCRAIRHGVQRRDCFESLRQIKSGISEGESEGHFAAPDAG